jgi:hypothetical protein
MRVYRSACGEFVLKTPLSPQRAKERFAEIGLPLDRQSWAPVRGDAFGSARELLERSQHSYALALEHLRTETCILDGEVGEVLAEPRPSLYKRELQGSTWILQPCVGHAGDLMKRALAERNLELAELYLHRLIELTRELWSKGITEDTFEYWNNYGIDPKTDTMVLFDIGELTRSPEKVERFAQIKYPTKARSLSLLRAAHLGLAEWFSRHLELLCEEFASLPVPTEAR